MDITPKYSLPPLPKPNTVNFRNAQEEWYSENESELIDVWHALQDNINRRGLVMFDKCRFNHFCAFILSMTTTRRDRCI